MNPRSFIENLPYLPSTYSTAAPVYYTQHKGALVCLQLGLDGMRVEMVLGGCRFARPLRSMERLAELPRLLDYMHDEIMQQLSDAAIAAARAEETPCKS
jgi:hypothetical protein